MGGGGGGAKGYLYRMDTRVVKILVRLAHSLKEIPMNNVKYFKLLNASYIFCIYCKFDIAKIHPHQTPPPH